MGWLLPRLYNEVRVLKSGYEHYHYSGIVNSLYNQDCGEQQESKIVIYASIAEIYQVKYL